MSSLSLNPGDIEVLIRAVRTANRRGAYELEEASQLLQPVTNLEEWVKEVAQARASVETEPKKEKE